MDQICPLNAITYYMVTSGRTSRWLLTPWTQHESLSCRLKFNTQWMDLPSFIKTRCQADTEAMAVLLWLRFLAQKAISAGGEELLRQTALSSFRSLLAVRFAANMMKVKGQFLVFMSSIVCIPRLIQEALSGSQQSLNLKRWEVTPSSFRDELQ